MSGDGEDDLAEVYLAGVRAGVEACAGVFTTIVRRHEGGEE
jgi:hypothetical protein